MRTFFAICFLLNSINLYACSCAESDSIEADFAVAGVVFVGHVVDVKRYPAEKFTQIAGDHYKINSQTQMTTLVVEQLLKSKNKINSDTIVIFSEVEPGTCGYIFEFGNSYVVYANRCPFYQSFSQYERDFQKRPFYRTSSCHRTTSNVSKELDLLKEAELL